MPTSPPQFEVVDQLVAFMATYGLSVLGGFVILIIGFWIAGRAERLVDRALGGVAVMDQTLRRFTARMVRYVILVFTGLSVWGRFGIETTYRQLQQARIQTCTRDPLLRLLYVGIALILRNIWVWLHWEVLSDPRRGGRRVNLNRLVFRKMLHWLQHLAEALFGFCDEICSKRPMPT